MQRKLAEAAEVVAEGEDRSTAITGGSVGAADTPTGTSMSYVKQKQALFDADHRRQLKRVQEVVEELSGLARQVKKQLRVAQAEAEGNALVDDDDGADY